MPALRFNVDRNSFENGSFRKRRHHHHHHHHHHVISLSEFSSTTEYKITGDCCVFKFLQRSVNRKHFRMKPPFSKFMLRSVVGALVGQTFEMHNNFSLQ